ncbi:MAG: nucleotidyltransferase family protein [Alphaproteobacteria bacterium]|nr:nucleotidyltransferase family protein [Alphaproteobacteria bacterium]
MIQPQRQPPIEKYPVACIVLAAGQSKRFGRANKLLAKIDGTSLIRATLDRVLASRCAHVSVIVQPHPLSAELFRALAGLNVHIVENPRFTDGLGTSISAGAATLPQRIAGTFILPGDMPWVEAATLDAMISLFQRPSTNHRAADRVVVPLTADNRQRNPVLWPKRYFACLMELDADQGAKALIPREAQNRINYLVAVSRQFGDVDRPADLPVTNK